MATHRRVWLLAGMTVLALAACSVDKGSQDRPETPAATQASPQFSVGPGTDLQITTGGRQLPGCNDPNDSECPAPLAMDLDATTSVDGVTIRYATRYFAVQTGSTAGGPLIEIAPNDAACAACS